jgi:hypothetical protein
VIDTHDGRCIPGATCEHIELGGRRCVAVRASGFVPRLVIEEAVRGVCVVRLHRCAPRTFVLCGSEHAAPDEVELELDANHPSGAGVVACGAALASAAWLRGACGRAAPSAALVALIAGRAADHLLDPLRPSEPELLAAACAQATARRVGRERWAFDGVPKGVALAVRVAGCRVEIGDGERARSAGHAPRATRRAPTSTMAE